MWAVFSAYPRHLADVGWSSYHLCNINGIFWLGGRSPDRVRGLLPNPLSQSRVALLPVPSFVPSSVDFTTFVLSCLTPRLLKYFPKIMSPVWVCSFSRMNHCERGHEPRKGECVSGSRGSGSLPANWRTLKWAAFPKAAAGLARVSHCAQNSPLGVVRFPFLLPKIDLRLFSSPDVGARVLRGVRATGTPFVPECPHWHQEEWAFALVDE